MKKLVIILLSMSFIFTGCSKKDDPEPTSSSLSTSINNPYSSLAKEYGIDKDVDYMSAGIDTNLILFNGRINSKLWIECFEKESKKQILDWTETTKLDTTLSLYEGYGEYKDFKIKKFYCTYFYKFNDSYSFILGGQEDALSPLVYTDLYFIEANKLIKKYRTTPNPYDDVYWWGPIYPWVEGVIATLGNKQAFYNMSGDSLFAINSSITINNKCAALSSEEAIKYNLDLSKKTIYFSKLNIKTNVCSWVTDTLTLEESQETIKVSSIDVAKAINNWTYTINYTRYSGEKKSVQIDLNVNTGEIELK